MAGSDSSRFASLVLIIIMAGLWIVLLVTMRNGVDVPSLLSGNPAEAQVHAGKARLQANGVPATGDDEISSDEYDVLQQVLNTYPQLTTVFEAAMVDGKMTYAEAENILERKEALEAEAEAGRQKQARERLLSTIEKLRSE